MDAMEIDDDIYINTYKTITIDGLTTRVDFQRGKKSWSCATLCLGLLCAVLMMGNIAQIIYYEIISGRSSAAPQQAAQGTEHLQNESDVLRALQNTYNSLWRTNSRLQANYSLLVTDKDKTDRLIAKLRAKPCRSGWTKFEFTCYFFSTLKRNWTESRKACQAQGADLVVLDSREEQVFINKKLNKGQNVWIGLTDSLMEGKWMWVDGTPITMEFWQPGQPNGFNGDQDCAELVQTSEAGEWNDDGCFADQKFICEQ